MTEIPEELKDPITLDIIEDPVALICCGRVVSRSSIVSSLKSSSDCPLCKQNLSTFDATAAPRVVNMAYMIDEFHKVNSQRGETVPVAVDDNNKWDAKIEYIVTGNAVYQTVIGELVVSNPKFKTFSNLLLAVVDKSGSMSGTPIKQVQYSLLRLVDMTFRTPTLMSHIVPYSDTASSVFIDRINGIPHYEQVIANLSNGMGGTSFKAAFNEIIRVCTANMNNNMISQMTVIFLTDGQDSSNVSRVELVNDLKTQIKQIWFKPFVVHTVGFGQGHDFAFLNNLKNIGTSEGAYKFADPTEDNDSLSNKINSILNVISESTAVPVQLTETENSLPIIGGENGTYWVNMSKYDHTKEYTYKVTVNGSVAVTVPVSSIAPYEGDGNEGDHNKMQKKWYSYLIDEIAGELIAISGSAGDDNKAIDKQIHLELLMQRSRSILIRLFDPANIDRLKKLMETINQLKAGNKVNQMKLTDIKSEGKFMTITTGTGDGTKQANAYQSSLYGQQVTAPVRIKKQVVWPVIKMGKRYCKTGIFELMGHYKTEKIIEWIEQNKETEKMLEVDKYGSNALIFASSMKRVKVVDSLLNTGRFDVNARNNNGYSALDMAFIYGAWYTVELLMIHGARTFQDGQMLLRTCVAKTYFNSATRLIKNHLAVISDEMIDECPNNKGVEWLSISSSVNVSIETAIIKGMYDYLTNMVIIEPVSVAPFIDIFSKCTNDHIRILEHLVNLKLINLSETVEITDEVDQTKDITWPLYNASRRGNVAMVNFIIQHMDSDLVNMCNKKGVTALWAAVAYSKSIEVVAALLTAGADPNIANIKGDSCLIPASQKEENLMMVEILLDAGARLDVFNPERENAVLISCRTGQAKILELLLKSLTKEQQLVILNTAANIDQFWPLIAAVELDKTECIRVCIKYGSDIEKRTPDDNQILAGATSVHLACQYNRLASLVLLAESGADMRAKTSIGGFTCMHIAIKSGHRDVIAYLLSTEIGKESLQMVDDSGHVPQYYSTIAGNEHIYEEFFVNKLGVLLEKALYSGQDMEQKCVDTLMKYGRSMSCYDYDNITEMNLGKGETLLVKALLNNNMITVNSLLKMGSRTDKADDFGISPDFWLHLLGSSNVVQPNENTVKMLSRVKLVAKSSIQNKMLTNLGTSNGAIMLSSAAGGTLDQLTKMSDGYSLKVKNDVLSALKTFGVKTMNHSLLTFMDKVKSSNKDVIDYMMFQGKVQLIKIIASSDDLILEPNHIMALYLYTSSPLFYCVNKTLMNWNDKQNEIYKPFIGALYQGVKQLPCHVGEVYRAVDTMFDPELYAINNVISWNAFSVCSKARGSCNDIINANKGIIFVIQSQTGRDVSKYTDNPANEDVIFLPESKFRISNHHIASMICIAQANIRNTTFGINDKNRESYYGKALNGKACVIITLEQVNEQSSSVSIQAV